MKKYIFFMLLPLSFFTSKAQKVKSNSIGQRLQAIEDRISIKNVVDTFSVLADHKDIKDQVLLFTEDAVVDSRVNGQPGLSLKGRKQIGDAFSGYLANFETVYHINGQQTLTLKGDSASGPIAGAIKMALK